MASRYIQIAMTTAFICIVFCYSYYYSYVMDNINIEGDLLAVSFEHAIGISQYRQYASCPSISIPALLIIGPPKSGTTSLITNLAHYFPNWLHQTPIKENGHWYGALRLDVMRNRTRLNALLSTIETHLSRIDSVHDLNISRFAFESLFTDDVWPQDEILSKKNQFINTLLESTSPALADRITNCTYIVEKTAFNFYLFHLVQAFGEYFSWRPPVQHPLHGHGGTKVVAILRDPTRRVISWHTMKQTLRSKVHSLDFYVLNMSQSSRISYGFRELIQNRQNESDDTRIMLLYIKWLYSLGSDIKAWRGPLPNIWLSEYILMFGIEYPMLLCWIYGYRHLQVATHFKVIKFESMIDDFRKTMFHIRCWVEHDITQPSKCQRMIQTVYYSDVNHSLQITPANRYSDQAHISDSLVEYMKDFYEPIAREQEKLIQRTGALLEVD